MSKRKEKMYFRITIPALQDGKKDEAISFVKDKVMKIRWGNVIEGFDMPLRVYINSKEQWLSPTTAWTEIVLVDANPNIKIDANFYISTQSVLGN